MTGVSRRVQPLSRDLALPAAKEALKRADRKPEDIDLIVLARLLPITRAEHVRGSAT